MPEIQRANLPPALLLKPPRKEKADDKKCGDFAMEGGALPAVS